MSHTDLPFPDALRDRYEPLGALGQGAMGAVFRVRDRRVEREAALKVLRLAQRADIRRRFQQEAALLARVEHPGILRVFDFGEVDGDMFMVTELLEGASLDRLPAPEDPLAWMMPAAEALEVVHDAGLVHRDVKPANIFRTDAGRIVLLDFGLALDPEVTRVTVDGGVVGTLAYMAPEILGLAEATPAADWYSWGVSLYWLVERGHPYQYPDLLKAAGGGALPPMRLRATPPDGPLERVIRGTVRQEPEKRLRGASAIQEAITSTGPLSGAMVRRGPLASVAPPDPRRIPWVVVGAATTVFLAGVLGWVSTAGGPAPSPSTSPVVGAEVSGDEARAGELLIPLEEMERELTEAGDLYRRKDEYRNFPSGSPGDGWTPLLSRDTANWGYLLPQLPALERAGRWAAEGGRRGDLSPEAWARLVALERRYQSLGLPRLLVPLLEERELGDLSPEVRAGLAPIDGDLAEALSCQQRLVDWRADIDEALERYHRGGPAPPGIDPLLLDFGSAPLRIRLRTLVEVALPDRDRRVKTAALLRPHGEDLRRLVFRGFRALATSPEPARVAHVLAKHIDRHATLFSTEISLLPPWLHSSGAPDGLASRVLRAAVLRYVTRYRRAYSRPWRDLARRRRELLPEVLEARPGETRWTAMARRRGVRELLHAHLELDEPTRALEVFRRHQGLLDTGAGVEHLRLCVELLGPMWAKYPDLPATTASIPELLGLFGALEGYRTELRFDDFWQEVELLRRRFGA